MAHVVAPNLRGKGISATKFTKDGKPKRSGNWSVTTIHFQSLQFMDYHVSKDLIVGEHTHLSQVMPDVWKAIVNDPYFDSYVQVGVKTVNGKKYEAQKRLTKVRIKSMFNDCVYTYREEIYTDGDFNYTFPEY